MVHLISNKELYANFSININNDKANQTQNNKLKGKRHKLKNSRRTTNIGRADPYQQIIQINF
jgi:hypothetical protein